MVTLTVDPPIPPLSGLDKNGAIGTTPVLGVTYRLRKTLFGIENEQR